MDMTVGPKTQSVEMLGKLYEAGMRCARMNFSHGSHEVQNNRSALDFIKILIPIGSDSVFRSVSYRQTYIL